MQRISKRIKLFFKKWPYWIGQFLLWIIMLIRDHFATEFILWYWGQGMKSLVGWAILRLPENLTEWSFIILAASVAGVLLYDLVIGFQLTLKNSC